MPQDLYSSLAISPNSLTNVVSLVAAKPSEVGHLEKEGVKIPPTQVSSSLAPCLGSVAIVTGIPNLVLSAFLWRLLLNLAIASGVYA